MAFAEVVGLIVLGFTWGAQITLRSLVRFRKWWAAGSALVILMSLVYAARLQYKSFQANPIGQFLLPPHHSWNYFLLYAGERIFAPWFIAALAGIFAAYCAARLNRRFGERFFEEEEPFLFGFAVFLTGYPTFLFYIALMLGAGALLTLCFAVLKKGRAPLYYLWMPVAISAILLTHFYVSRSFLVRFNL